MGAKIMKIINKSDSMNNFKEQKRDQLLKEYFRKFSTVSKWWEPELKEGVYKEKYIRERADIISLTNKPKGKTILDVGTGKGRFAIDFALRGDKVTACDISKEMLDIAKKRAKRVGVESKITFELGDKFGCPDEKPGPPCP